MELSFIMLWFTSELSKGKNPFNEIHNYKQNMRGMDWRRDITDWVGGWPYEFASPEEVDIFMKELGWTSIRSNLTTGWGCNEYLYKNIEKAESRM